MSELDRIIDELSVEVSHKYPSWETLIKSLIDENKGEIKNWLKKNRKRLIRVLKTL